MTALLSRANSRLNLPGLLTIGCVALAIALLMGWAIPILLVAILLPTALAIWQRPQVGVIIFVALLPFDGLLIIADVPSFVEGWKQTVILVLLILTFVCPPSARSTEERRLPPYSIAVLLLFFVALASAYFTDRTTAVIGLRIMFFSVLLGAVVWRCPFSRRERDALVTVLMAVAFIVALVAIWQQLVGHAYLNQLGYEYGDGSIRFADGLRLRSFATFNQPFPCAFFLMLVLLLGLPFALDNPRRLRNLLFLLAIPIYCLALVFTFVRASFLGLGIGLLYLAFHRFKLLVYGIPLVLCALLFVPSGTSFTSAITQSNSLQARTTTWGDRFSELMAYPLGRGVGTTGAAAEKVAVLENKNPDETFQPDNAYLKVAFELGLPGLWLMLMLLISMFLYARAIEKRADHDGSLFAVGVQAQLLAIMAASAVATYFEMVPMDQMFWLMAAIVATLSPTLKPGAASTRSADALALGAASA